MSDKSMHAFITGSRAYGKPKDDSDVDLVIRVDAETRDFLTKMFVRTSCEYDVTSTSIQCGSLHMVLCTTDESFSAWKIGTEVLKKVAPVTKEQATNVFEIVRDRIE